MSGRRILIAGCGYVGTALGERLAARGHTVWGLRRNPGDIDSDLPSAIEGKLNPLRADLRDTSTLTKLPEALDYVVYCASADARDPGAYRAAYVDGPRNLLAALRDAGQSLTRLVFTSSTAVYAQRDGEEVDEESPAEGAGVTGKLLVDAEKQVQDSGVDTVVLRLGGIYGPGRTRLIDSVRKGTARRSGAARFTNRIHRDDCAGAIEHLLTLPDARPVYLGVDADPASMDDVLLFLADKLGVAPPKVEPKSDTEVGHKRCRGERLRQSGYWFAVPTYREGYAAMIAEQA